MTEPEKIEKKEPELSENDLAIYKLSQAVNDLKDEVLRLQEKNNALEQFLKEQPAEVSETPSVKKSLFDQFVEWFEK
jgi:predicted RNase H-like nuclease (RuvC/YqgF family)